MSTNFPVPGDTIEVETNPQIENVNIDMINNQEGVNMEPIQERTLIL